MASKTRLLEWVRNLESKQVAAALAESPKLLDFRDDRGRNWLHLCCGVDPKARKLSVSNGIKTADVLLAAGLDINQEAFREGEWKATPLWYAVARGHNLTLAKWLLDRGSDPNHCLWAAGFRDNVPMIKLLVGAGADIEAVAEGSTPFLSAIKTSHFRAAKALLELGANVDFQDEDGRTALHCMLKKSSDEPHFRMLVRHGARGDIPDHSAKTAS